jgi:hypothetical protein
MLLNPHGHSTRASATTRLTAGLAAAITLSLAAPAARAALIDVRFESTGSNPSIGDTAGSAYVGSAMVGSMADQWNTFESDTGTAALTDSTGAATGLSVNYSSQQVYGLPSYGELFTGTSYAALMQSFLVTKPGWMPITLMISGLNPDEAFSVYLYGQSGANNRAYGETATVNGATATAYQGTSATFVPNVDYLLFNGTASAGGTISVTELQAAGASEGDLNGLQLVTAAELPEPASMVILAAGLFGLSVARRRRA